MLRRSLVAAATAAVMMGSALSSTGAIAKTEIQWWHAFNGRLGELLDEQVKKFNASQSDYVVVASSKGNPRP